MIAASHRPLKRRKGRRKVGDRRPRTETLMKLNLIEPGGYLDPDKEKRIALWGIRVTMALLFGLVLFTVLKAIDPNLQPVIDFARKVRDHLLP